MSAATRRSRLINGLGPADDLQWNPRCRLAHGNGITRPHNATLFHGAHDASLANDGATRRTIECRLKQAWPELVDLFARVAETSHADRHFRADTDQRTA